MKRLTLLAITMFTFLTYGFAYQGTDSIGYFLKGQDTVVIFEVGSGETLSSIARKYNISIAGITAFNPNIKPDQLREGQIIKLPGAKLRKQYVATGSATVTSEPQVTTGRSVISSQSHTIMQGETLYAIARHYGVSVEEIITANPGLQPDKIDVNQVITIPVKATPKGNMSTPVEAPKSNTNLQDQGPSTTDLVKSSDIEKPTDQPLQKPLSDKPKVTQQYDDAQFHLVKKGETMFSISRQYNVTVTDIKEWNRLESFQIDIGDQLIVGLSQTAEADASTSLKPQVTSNDNNESPVKEPAVKARFAYNGMDNILSLQYKEDLSSNYFKEERNNGIATWISDVDGYPYDNGYFALHRTLPIGTVVKVRNLMNDKIVFAKVIGRLPNTDANEKIMLKLPEAAKEDLKVLDAQLVMEVSYLRKMN